MATSMPDYSVDIMNTELVVPLLPSQHRTLPLSNLDLTIPPVSFHIFFCYNKPVKKTFASVLSHLKISLSRAFVSYYVLVGRLVINNAGEPELQCNNNGAEFSEAYAATVLSDVNFYNPDKSVQGKLVPQLAKAFHDKGTPVFAVQVTRFSYGGITVGCTFDHRIADAYSANMFLTCWAKLSRDESIESPYPSFTSSTTLRPRDLPSYSSEIEKLYVKQTPREAGQETPLTSRIYYLDAKDIENLQISASENGNKYSKLESFCAYLWKLLMHTQAVNDKTMSKFGIVVDGRSRLTNMGMPPNYFGNVLLLPFADACAGDIKNKPLFWAAQLMHNVIRTAVDEEHFQSLIDFVEITKPGSALAKIYCKRDDPLSSAPAVLVSSGLRFGLYEVDHGWGGRICDANGESMGGWELGGVFASSSPSLGCDRVSLRMHAPSNHRKSFRSLTMEKTQHIWKVMILVHSCVEFSFK